MHIVGHLVEALMCWTRDDLHPGYKHMPPAREVTISVEEAGIKGMDG